jgi:hypothetical protein
MLLLSLFSYQYKIKVNIVENQYKKHYNKVKVK